MPWPKLLDSLRPKAPIHDLATQNIAQLLTEQAPATPDIAVLSDQAAAEATFDEHIGPLIAEAERAEIETAAEVPVTTPAPEIIPEPTRRPDPFQVPTRKAPKLATNPGDLVMVFGLRDDALVAAQALQSAHTNIELGIAGTIGRPGTRHVGNRREAAQAQADAVVRGGSVIVAVGIGQSPEDAAQYATILDGITPSQIWVAVDVTRKPEDTRVWAQAVADAGTGIDAIAALGVAYTTTPDSTTLLGVPVGWSDNSGAIA